MSEINLSSQFLQVAACPRCHASLAIDYERSELVCVNPECALAYPVRDSIPVLLIDQARDCRAGRDPDA